jgi:hypothetical protein
MTLTPSNEGSSSVAGHPRKRPTGSSFPSAEQGAVYENPEYSRPKLIPRLKADHKINKAHGLRFMPAVGSLGS